jgi:hypothetical protein
VLQNTDGVLEVILSVLLETPSPARATRGHPLPVGERGRGVRGTD